MTGGFATGLARRGVCVCELWPSAVLVAASGSSAAPLFEIVALAAVVPILLLMGESALPAVLLAVFAHEAIQTWRLLPAPAVAATTSASAAAPAFAVSLNACHHLIDFRLCVPHVRTGGCMSTSFDAEDRRRMLLF